MVKTENDMVEEGGGSYLIIKNSGHVVSFFEHGIKNLWQAASGKDKILQGADVEDSIVGKAAALLMIFGGAKSVKAGVLSEGGKCALEEYGVPYAYDVLVPNIINRRGDGLCPMEEVAKDCDPTNIVAAIEQKLIALGML